ncbi:hypothetical protein BT69DRAFT_1321947 [Atractiella rhizophila]|nr:hypothetical protein BT69DRAFT_1321947 [Atractiella rhizophila]
MPATDNTSERNSRKHKCCLYVIWICLHRRYLADAAALRGLAQVAESKQGFPPASSLQGVDLQPEPRSDKLEIPEPWPDAPDVQYKTRVPYIPRLPYGASHKIPQRKEVKRKVIRPNWANVEDVKTIGTRKRTDPCVWNVKLCGGPKEKMWVEDVHDAPVQIWCRKSLTDEPLWNRAPSDTVTSSSSPQLKPRAIRTDAFNAGSTLSNLTAGYSSRAKGHEASNLTVGSHIRFASSTAIAAGLSQPIASRIRLHNYLSSKGVERKSQKKLQHEGVARLK